MRAGSGRSPRSARRRRPAARSWRPALNRPGESGHDLAYLARMLVWLGSCPEVADEPTRALRDVERWWR
jgi:hypothetical protein